MTVQYVTLIKNYGDATFKIKGNCTSSINLEKRVVTPYSILPFYDYFSPEEEKDIEEFKEKFSMYQVKGKKDWYHVPELLVLTWLSEKDSTFRIITETMVRMIEVGFDAFAINRTLERRLNSVLDAFGAYSDDEIALMKDVYDTLLIDCKILEQKTIKDFYDYMISKSKRYSLIGQKKFGRLMHNMGYESKVSTVNSKSSRYYQPLNNY